MAADPSCRRDLPTKPMPTKTKTDYLETTISDDIPIPDFGDELMLAKNLFIRKPQTIVAAKNHI